MSDSDVARFEENLRLTLPREFVEIVRQFSQEVEELQGTYRKGVKCPLIHNGSYLISVNQSVWGNSRPKDWPDGFFVCGYDGCGKVKYLIDSREASAQVWELAEKTNKPVPCKEYPDLPSLAAFALRTYREFDSKESRKRGKAQPVKDFPQQKNKKPADKPVSPAPVERKSVVSQVADPRLVTKLKNALLAAGFELEKPERKHPIELLIGDLIPALPKDLHALYTLCDGGFCERHSLRILPLAQAAELAKTYYLRAWPRSGLIGVIQAESCSIDCAVSLHRPLEGYVVAIHEGQFKSILARSFIALLGILASNLDSDGWDLETALFGKPPPDHTPFEFVEGSRTTDDLRRARELSRLAEADFQTHHGDEYRPLFEMAWKLYSEAEVGEIFPMLKHEDSQVRVDAMVHLSGIRTPEVGRAFEAIQPELPDYIKEAVAVFRKAKLDAHVVHRVWIRIDPGPVWIDPSNCRYDTRTNPDHWDGLVRWVKYCAANMTG
jgi:hypothetical protein